MANATYDTLWQQAIAELGEQLHVEGADEEEDELENTGQKVSIVIARLLSWCCCAALCLRALLSFIPFADPLQVFVSLFGCALFLFLLLL